MTNRMKPWIIAAAAIVSAAGSAAAQNFEAQIPMSFRVGNTLMQPGTYEIKVVTGVNTRLFVSNRDTRNAVLLVSSANSDAPSGWRRGGKPNLKFECVNRACSLQQFWDGAKPTVYNFPIHKSPTLEARQTESVDVAMIRTH